MATIFSKIHSGEIPACMLFCEPHWFGILDLFPVRPGHLLLVPTVEAARMQDLPPEILAGLGDVIARGTRCLYRALECDAVSVLLRDGPAAGQEVPHVHWHLIPRDQGDDPHLFAGGSYGDTDELRERRMQDMLHRLQACWL